MKKIKVGVTPGFFYPDLNRMVFGPKTLSYMEKDLGHYLATEQSLPYFIPHLPEQYLKEFLSTLDAVVFAGGSDVSPHSYGETPIENGRWPGDIFRDQYEFKIAQLALELGKPILGICRGCQLLNVFFGGSLYQDLHVQLKTPVEHRHAEKYDHVSHQVNIAKDSWLFKLYQKTSLKVNSVHHQGIKTLGKNLIAEAFSHEDQLIEAWRLNDPAKFVWAVQWHPEFGHTLGTKIDSCQEVIQYFLEVIKK